MQRRPLDDPDLPLAELMARWPQTVPVFLRHRMLCVGCLVGPFHTVLDACAEYGLETRPFYAELFASLTPALSTGQQDDADQSP